MALFQGKRRTRVKSGIQSVKNFFRSGVGLTKSANEEDSVVYYAHTISRTGTYLSSVAGIREGEPLAYLIAPPLEAVVMA